MFVCVCVCVVFRWFFRSQFHRNWNRRVSKSNRSLLAAVVDTFWKDYAFLAVMCFFNDIVLRLGQQILLGNLLLYFRTVTTITYQNALVYAVGIVLLNGLCALLSNHIMFLSFHYGMKIRIAVCSLVYRKVIYQLPWCVQIINFFSPLNWRHFDFRRPLLVKRLRAKWPIYYRMTWIDLIKLHTL